MYAQPMIMLPADHVAATTYDRREVEIESYIEQYIEEFKDTPDYMEVGERFGIHLDDLDRLERLVRSYDYEWGRN
jgi:hypothetical protein